METKNRIVYYYIDNILDFDQLVDKTFYQYKMLKRYNFSHEQIMLIIFRCSGLKKNLLEKEYYNELRKELLHRLKMDISV